MSDQPTTPASFQELRDALAKATEGDLAEACEGGFCVECEVGMEVEFPDEWPDDGLCNDCVVKRWESVHVHLASLIDRCEAAEATTLAQAEALLDQARAVGVAFDRAEAAEARMKELEAHWVSKRDCQGDDEGYAQATADIVADPRKHQAEASEPTASKYRWLADRYESGAHLPAARAGERKDGDG